MAQEIRSVSSTGGQKGTKMERHDLIPISPLQELAVHFGRGARKYDAHQWRAGYEWSKSYSAIQRHLSAFWKGFDYDVCTNEPDNCAMKLTNGEVIHYNFLDAQFETDGDQQILRLAVKDKIFDPIEGFAFDTCYNHTGSHHMTAVAWHAFVLLEFKDRFPEFDDRYIPTRQDD